MDECFLSVGVGYILTQNANSAGVNHVGIKTTAGADDEFGVGGVVAQRPEQSVRANLVGVGAQPIVVQQVLHGTNFCLFRYWNCRAKIDGKACCLCRVEKTA